MLKIFNFNDLGGSESLETFEVDHNIKLPEMYRKFLLKYNGGFTPKTSFKIGNISTDIRVFYGLSNAPKDFNFSYIKSTDYFQDRLSENYLPIATDSFGNLIVIDIIKDKNSICFFDSELQSYTHIADSLEDFFDVVKSKKFLVRTIDERIQGMKDSGSEIEIDNDLINLWQEEINKYESRKQENVSLK